MLAVVRVRGLTGVRVDIKETLKRLNLFRKNYCVVVPKTPAYLGMVFKVKDFAAYGEIDDATLNALREKRKSEGKPFFRLCPPRGGFERKGIKRSFGSGGALGYRGSAINELIMRMI